MTDQDRLADKLTKLATESAVIKEGWRRIEGKSPDNPLVAILTLIDETIFPVSVSLRNATGDVLNISVGNCRLRCVLGPLPKPLAGYEALCDVELGDWNSGMQDQIADMLRTHVADSPDIWARNAELPLSGSVGGGGLSADKLAVLCGIPPLSKPDVDLVAAFDAFTENLRSRSDGWLRLSEEDVVERAGLENLDIGVVKGILRLTSMNVPAKTASGPERPVLVILGARDDRQLTIARLGATSFVASVAIDIATELAEQWRSAGM